ncbi:DNA-binding IclR family transcriptional regulator [Variovorax sp. OAS795]|uniref:IclR family transcriptional regulator n=1 Tax=Variovorax sp. OAS795 TaxID=3034231 RepID=UPI003396C558
MAAEKTDEQKVGGVAAVERAFAILHAFRAGDTSLNLSELAQRTGMYKSTILRTMTSLIREHCIVRLDDGTYQLGSMLLHWGGLYQAALRLDDHVPAILRRLVQETGEGASFFTREDNLRVCLFRVDSPKSVRDHIRTGDLLPLDKGAAGRVLSSFDRALTPPANFPEQPFIVTIGEREPDIGAIAAPVFGPMGSLRGALAISGPSARFSSDFIPGMSLAVLKAASDLTRRLGGDPAVFETASAKFDFAAMVPSTPSASAT